MDGGRLLFQLLKIVFGFVLALVSSGLFLTWGFFQSTHPENDVVAVAAMIGTGLVSASVIGAATFLPAVVVICISEFGRFRSVMFHMAAGGGIAFLIWTIGSEGSVSELRPGTSIALTGGFLSGAIYWAIAGRTAGDWIAKPTVPGP